jgi:diguanylate cyclase (GGDEF)-like protein
VDALRRNAEGSMATKDETGPGSGTVARDEDEPFAHDLRAVLGSIGEAVYDWDIASDRIAWSGQAASVLGTGGVEPIASGRAFARLVRPDDGVSRYDTVMRTQDRDVGHGVAFQTRYVVTPPGGTPVCVEDTGRWFAGTDGRPAKVHGVVRVLPGVTSTGATAADPHQDWLTGAMTRAQLTEMLSDELARARRAHGSLALVMVGIEGLAAINEAYGFDVADEAIASVARRLRTVMRRGDAMARFSGNKLAIVLLGCSEEQLPVAAQRFVTSVQSTPLTTSKGVVNASIRLGGVLLPRFGQTAADAMANGEEALADAKASPTAQVVLFAPDRRKVERRMSNRRLTDEVVSALNDRRVCIVQQAVVDAKTRDVAFREALMRIRAVDGTVLPASFVVPMVEKLGFMPMLDQRVLELAANALEEDPGLTLSVNVSQASVSHPEWISALTAFAAPRPSLARRLIVELTETCFVHDIDTTRLRIAQIKDLGVRVAIDDFGSGHTSFRHLRDLHVDIIKIDGAFVQNIVRSNDDRFFVRTLLELARHLDVLVVAEWVQDEAAARILADWGVDFLQGELFDMPELAQQEPAAPLPATGTD